MIPGQQGGVTFSRIECWCLAAWWQQVGGSSITTQPASSPQPAQVSAARWSTNIMPGPGDVGVMPTDTALPAPFSIPPAACSQRPISRSIDRQINHSEVMIHAGFERHWVWLSWPLSGDIQAAPRRWTRSVGAKAAWTGVLPNSAAHLFRKGERELPSQGGSFCSPGLCPSTFITEIKTKYLNSSTHSSSCQRGDVTIHHTASGIFHCILLRE